MTTSRSQLKKWFSNGAKPNQAQFAELIDAYYHQQDTIPATAISGLDGLFSRFMGLTKEQVEQLISDQNIGTLTDFTSAFH